MSGTSVWSLVAAQRRPMLSRSLLARLPFNSASTHKDIFMIGHSVTFTKRRAGSRQPRTSTRWWSFNAKASYSENEISAPVPGACGEKSIVGLFSIFKPKPCGLWNGQAQSAAQCARATRKETSRNLIEYASDRPDLIAYDITQACYRTLSLRAAYVHEQRGLDQRARIDWLRIISLDMPPLAVPPWENFLSRSAANVR